MNGHGKISKTLSEQKRVTERHIHRFKNNPVFKIKIYIYLYREMYEKQTTNLCSNLLAGTTSAAGSREGRSRVKRVLSHLTLYTYIVLYESFIKTYPWTTCIFLTGDNSKTTIIAIYSIPMGTENFAFKANSFVL